MKKAQHETTEALSKQHSFKNLHFEVTHRCNLRCAHCYNMAYIHSYDSDLSSKEVKRIIDIAYRLGIRDFGFSGGEPFMREDFLEILEYTPDVPIHILTNALLVEQFHLDFINSDKDLVEFRISLDGLSSQEKIRKVSYKKTLEKIALIKDAGFVTTVNTMITPDNIDELPSMYKLMENIKADRWRIDFIFATGNAKLGNFQVNDARLYDTLRDLIKAYIEERPCFEFDVNRFFRSFLIDGAEFITYDLESKPCEYQAALTIRPNGDISFCPSLDMTFGNILTDPLEKVVSSQEWKRIAELKVKELDPECINCEVLRLCGGGCRADAYYATGSIYKPYHGHCRAMKYFRQNVYPLLKS